VVQAIKVWFRNEGTTQDRQRAPDEGSGFCNSGGRGL